MKLSGRGGILGGMSEDRKPLGVALKAIDAGEPLRVDNFRPTNPEDWSVDEGHWRLKVATPTGERVLLIGPDDDVNMGKRVFLPPLRSDEVTVSYSEAVPDGRAYYMNEAQTRMYASYQKGKLLVPLDPSKPCGLVRDDGTWVAKQEPTPGDADPPETLDLAAFTFKDGWEKWKPPGAAVVHLAEPAARMTDIGTEPTGDNGDCMVNRMGTKLVSKKFIADQLRARAATLMYEGVLDAARILREEADAIEKAEQEGPA